MRPSLSLFLAACFAFTACGSLHRSPTWAAVISSRFDTRGAADPSEEYAGKLSSMLKSSHVEHKVVSYEFRYRTRLREEAIATRTAVVYRDGSSSRNPWWLMDERLRVPVWLPGNDLERQLSFYIRQPATVVSVDGKSASGDGKAQLTNEFDQPPALARLTPVRKTERSRPFVPPRQVAVAAKHTVSNRSLALFRAHHGSHFNPRSVADRLKMDRLLHRGHRSLASR